METYTVITESFVNVFITSNVNSFSSERKFAKDITVADLKGKLELITGASSLTMKISCLDKKGTKVCDLDDDSALLGKFPVENGMNLHIEDTNKHRDEFENLDNVEKFEMSAEEYSKRTNTVQSFLKRNQLGKYNEEEMKKIKEDKAKAEAKDQAEAAKINVGDRCQVTVPGSGQRRGVVKFVGKTHFKPGWWVGVQYDEPYGKYDGSVEGQRYFTCPPKYGSFVRVTNVETGDFPEEDLGLSDDEM